MNCGRLIRNQSGFSIGMIRNVAGMMLNIIGNIPIWPYFSYFQVGKLLYSSAGYIIYMHIYIYMYIYIYMVRGPVFPAPPWDGSPGSTPFPATTLVYRRVLGWFMMIQIASDVEWYVRVYINLVAPGVSPTFWVQNSNPRKVGAAQAPGSVEIRDPNEPWMWRPAKWKDWFHGKKLADFHHPSCKIAIYSFITGYFYGIIH